MRQQAPTFTNDTPIEVKEAIINKKTYPNFRIATFTVVGRYAKDEDEKIMTRNIAKTMRKLHQKFLDAHKVSTQINKEPTSFKTKITNRNLGQRISWKYNKNDATAQTTT